MAENTAIPVESHPWITFVLDLKRLPVESWLALGECASKCDHIANTPLRPHVRQQLHLLYLAKGVQATTAIEGNTLSEEQVRRRIEGKAVVPPSQQYLGQEVDNIVAACNLIGMRLREQVVPPITPELLCEYNETVLRALELPEGVEPGKFRQHSVTVGRYRGPDRRYVKMLVGHLCRWLQSGLDELVGHFGAVTAAILKAVLAHLYVAWIHPFSDGNGRTARLLEFDILLRSGVPSPAAHLLSNHYNQTRNEYYRQLDLASKKRDPSEFIAYAVQGFRDGLRDQLARIDEQMRDVVWRSYVYERFRGAVDSRAARRRRHVVLDVSLQSEPVPKVQIPVLSPRLREAYAGKTDRTLSRDLAEIRKMGLLFEHKGEYSPNRDLIEAFLPVHRDEGRETV